MRVKDAKTGRIADVSESYGARLIEQGRAVLAPSRKEAPRKAKEAPAAKKVVPDVTAG